VIGVEIGVCDRRVAVLACGVICKSTSRCLSVLCGKEVRATEQEHDDADQSRAWHEGSLPPNTIAAHGGLGVVDLGWVRHG
ncbi:MAG: hypothetical protein WB607_24065, partial [Candidatus Acidiferrum sp.]